MKHAHQLSLILLIFMIPAINGWSQGTAINTDGSQADNSAILDVSSTSKGILIPRMSASQKTAISSPAEGLLIYQNDGTPGYYYYNGTSWTLIGSSSLATWNQGVSNIYTTSNVSIGSASSTSEKLEVSGNIIIPGANTYKYKTAKTMHYPVSAYAFTTEGTYHRQSLAGGVYITDGSAGVQGNLYAGVSPPDGATVIKLDAYVVDNDGTGGHDIDYVQLWRNDAAVGSGFGNSTNMAQTNGTSTTSSAITKLTTSTITAPVIDNTNYSYYLRFGTRQAAPNLMLFKVVITYTITSVE